MRSFQRIAALVGGVALVALAWCCIPPQAAQQLAHDGCVLIEEETDASAPEKAVCVAAEELAPVVATLLEKRDGGGMDAGRAVLRVRIRPRDGGP